MLSGSETYQRRFFANAQNDNKNVMLRSKATKHLNLTLLLYGQK